MRENKEDFNKVLFGAVNLCRSGAGIGGLLIVGGSHEDIARLSADFLYWSEKAYPVVNETREEYEASGRKIIFNGVWYCCVELDKIEFDR